MQIARFSHAETIRYGIVDGDDLVVLKDSEDDQVGRDVGGLRGRDPGQGDLVLEAR